MREYLGKALTTFKENKQLFIQVSLGLGIILGLSTFIGAISGLFIFILFLILPLIVSVFAISMKTCLGKDATNKDLYFGYHRFGMSLVLTTKMLLKPILLGFLAYFLVAGIGYSIMFVILKSNGHPIFSIIATGDYAAISEELFELMSTNLGFLTITIVSLIIGFIVTYNVFLKRSLTPLICFETTFTMDSAKKMSKSYLNKERKFLLFNNIFLVMYVIFIVILELVEMIIFTGVSNIFVLYLIELLVIMILMAPLLYINTLFITHFYIDKYRDKTINLYHEYLNVSMRVNQDNVINNELNNSDKEDQK